ncbi:hypothetical protein EB796_005568 [Bugula neritina]|uniref:Uncharacterized protein n=1 Tax=Bugula neritina TaxID=10212 RepID=A0A7J7KBX5_BUGNE|nr:hypothetical protein EB796_005568 [Bugula neritina]
MPSFTVRATDSLYKPLDCAHMSLTDEQTDLLRLLEDVESCEILEKGCCRRPSLLSAKSEDNQEVAEYSNQ